MRKNQLVDLIESKTNRRFVRKEKTPTAKELRKIVREMGLVGVSHLPKSEILKRVDEKLVKVRKEEETYFEVQETRRALQKAMTTCKFNPLIQTDVQTFLEKTTTRRREVIEGLKKKRAKVEVVLKIMFVKRNPA